MSLPKTFVLYHYCSLNTFKNIFENNSIWLSDILKSNDYNELKWLNKRYHIFLAKAYNQLKESFGLDSEDMYQIMSANDAVLELSPVKSWCFCLSEEGDLLSQWRGYAEDGCGISIGLNSNIFENIYDECVLNKSPFLFDFKKILYGEQAAAEFFTKELNISSLSSKEEIVSHLQKGALAVALGSCFFKSDSFAEEKEWRLAINVLNDPKSMGSDYKKMFKDSFSTPAFNLNDFSYVSCKDDLISHIEIKFANISTVVSEIIIGPRAKINEWDIRSFLLSLKDFDEKNIDSIKIVKSKASYR